MRFLALAGFALYFRAPPSWRYARLWLAAVAVLLGFFVVFEYGYRLLSPGDMRQAAVAFTPSRFLTDLAYFLSLPAGYAVYILHRRTGWSVSWLAVGLLIASVSNFSYWKNLFVPGPSSDLVGGLPMDRKPYTDGHDHFVHLPMGSLSELETHDQKLPIPASRTFGAPQPKLFNRAEYSEK